MDKFIITNKIKDNKLIGQINVPQKLGKYFKTTTFFANYDADININPSITNIPLLATILPFAWITGYDIQVDELDKRFKESMDNLQQEFKKTYPLAQFTTKIVSNNLTKNIIGKINSDASTALLFSGGVDSTYSMVKNLESSPRLLMIWGVDNYPYPENEEQWNYLHTTYTSQAKKLGLTLNMVQTNVSQILDYKRIDHDFHKILFNGSFRFLFQHSFILMPLVAPLSIGRFNNLLIASSVSAIHDFEKIPWGSSPSIDEQVVWADIEVKHDGAIDRSKKIAGDIKAFFEENQLKLKVCVRKLNRPELNDCICTKCFRTIMTLILSGVDPNTCGFKVDDSTFHIMKETFSHPMRGSMIKTYLVPIQKMVPPDFEFEIAGSKEFFAWFRDYPLKSLEGLGTLRSFYYLLPFRYAKFLDAIYRKYGIHIHEKTTQRN